MISLEQTEMNVKEDEGNVNIYLTTGEMELCLKIITLPDGAGKLYTQLGHSSDMHFCHTPVSELKNNIIIHI